MTAWDETELKIIDEECEIYDNLIKEIFNLFESKISKDKKRQLDFIIIKYELQTADKEVELETYRKNKYN